MKVFVTYLRSYLRNISPKVLIFTIVFAGLLTTVNYTLGIERRIRNIHPWYLSLMSFFFFYGFVFFFTWGLQYSAGARLRGGSRRYMLALLLLGPLYFSCKMVHWDLSILLPGGVSSHWDRYALILLQLPAKLLLLITMLWFVWKTEVYKGGTQNWLSFYGLTARGFKARPYVYILLLMLPLVVLASTRPDFLHTYPKVKNISFISDYARPVWPWQLLYEISYGLDFVSIELFFRGLLVIGLARYAGQFAILPMAAFYCTIHFGKPLGECISSFFGGLVLGVIALESRSVLGGLVVHLGLAWMMEAGGWLGN